MKNNRVYNLILTKRQFGKVEHTYVLLGFENGETWNLLGGQQDPEDKNSEAAAARELYEESGMFFDKRNDSAYWYNLSFYEHTIHKVFIHPHTLNCDIQKLNLATKACRENKNLTHDYKEMWRYQIVKLSDLINLANSQTTKGQNGIYNHPSEKEPMKIDGWMLFTLKNADKAVFSKYL